MYPGFEYAMYGWIAVICMLFGFFAIRRIEDVREMLPVAFVLCVVPLAGALLHLRIRKERAKGRDAIYERMVAVSGRRRRRRRED